ncbi:MAG: ParB/RepB/Spo0J family partition protein [Blastocatellia bacterium]|nr:ParB/RepB/Spo0J family partition protein [Blastocatellia bacterium]MBK6427107.1 ParB/RepB/Spo0J family partition protein [Blastocatellia bacterium]
MAKKRIGIDALFQSSVPAADPALAAEAALLDSTGLEGIPKFELAVDSLVPGRHQPRVTFDAAALRDLTESVRVHGVLQPILVRLIDDSSNEYEIVAGERRWRAAQAAGLSEVPVRVISLDDVGVRTVAMVENLQREDLNVLEEAEGYLDLLADRMRSGVEFESYVDVESPQTGAIRLLRALNNRLAGNSKDDAVLRLEPAVAEVFSRVGRITWQSFVSHRLPLLSLPSELLDALRSGRLTYSKARAIGRLTAERLGGDEDNARAMRLDLIERAGPGGLSVRALQAEVRKLTGEPASNSQQVTERSSTTVESVKTFQRGSSTLDGKIVDLIDRLESTNLEDYGPARRTEISSAIDALLRAL